MKETVQKNISIRDNNNDARAFADYDPLVDFVRSRIRTYSTPS
jgi:hypothetical protein